MDDKKLDLELDEELIKIKDSMLRELGIEEVEILES